MAKSCFLFLFFLFLSFLFFLFLFFSFFLDQMLKQSCNLTPEELLKHLIAHDQQQRPFALSHPVVLYSEIFTVRKRSCGKVMFSQTCDKNSVHGGGVCQIPPKHSSNFTIRKRSCGEVMFSQVCVKNSVHRGCPARHPPGQTPPPPPPSGQTPPSPFWQADSPLQQTATAADGTHPTGMHSYKQ